MVVASNRYSTSNVQLTKGGVVVHTSEGGEGGNSAAALILFMATPGTRPNGSGGTYGSSYHAVATEAGDYVMVLGASAAPYAAPPLNQEWWHIVIPGTAQQSPEQWTDPVSRQYLKGVAKFIYDKSLIDSFPLKRVNGSQLRAAGEKALRVGYCGHADVRDAFGETDHYDPGPWFPWDLLQQEINALIPPPPPPPPPLLLREFTMPIVARWKDDPATWITIDANIWSKIKSFTDVTWYDAFGLVQWVDASFPGAVGPFKVNNQLRYVAELDRNAGLGIGTALSRITQIGV